jgi:hypothetical protein
MCACTDLLINVRVQHIHLHMRVEPSKLFHLLGGRDIRHAHRITTSAGGGTAHRRSCAANAKVSFAEVKLRREVLDSRLLRVVKRERLDPREGNVLGDFDSETAQPNQQDGRLLHLSHRIVSKYVQLSAVQSLVHLCAEGTALSARPHGVPSRLLAGACGNSSSLNFHSTRYQAAHRRLNAP